MSKPPALTATPIYSPRPTPPTTLILTLPSAHLAPTSFCKCTCGANSTIIPLDGPLSNHPSPSNNLLLPRLDDRKGWPLFASTDSPLPSNSQEAETETPTPTPGKDKGDSGGGGTADRKEYRAGNCNDCNRQFCLDYMNLPICKGKGAEEIFTTCFRASFTSPPSRYQLQRSLRLQLTNTIAPERDSRKDEAVVYIFIVATAGLLTWAAIKPWVGRWVEVSCVPSPFFPNSNPLHPPLRLSFGARVTDLVDGGRAQGRGAVISLLRARAIHELGLVLKWIQFMGIGAYTWIYCTALMLRCWYSGESLCA